MTIMHTGRWALVLALVAASGCASGRNKEKPGGVAAALPTVRAWAFSGSGLSGEMQRPVDAKAAGCRVTLHVDSLPKLPKQDFEPIGSRTRLVLSDGSGDLLRPASRLAYAVSTRSVTSDFDTSPLRTEASDLGSYVGGVFDGTSYALKIDQSAALADRPGRQQLQVILSRGENDSKIDLTLVSDDRVTTPSTKTLESVRETIVAGLDVPEGRTRLLLALPIAPAGSDEGGVLIDLTVDKTVPNSEAVQVARNDIAARLAAAATQPTQAVTAEEAVMSAALKAVIDAGERPRAALVYLAQQGDAPLSEQVALVADDDMLKRVAATISERSGQLPSFSPADVGWMMERATIQAIAAVSDDEDAAASLLPVQAVLAQAAGEAGRQIDLLLSLANESAGPIPFQGRLRFENETFLEDNSPAVRVRAYDWLKRQGETVPGYDPLEPRTSVRRAALTRYREAAATQPSPAN